MNWYLIVLGALLLAYPAFEVVRVALILVAWATFKVADLITESSWGFLWVAAVLALIGTPTLLAGLGVL